MGVSTLGSGKCSHWLRPPKGRGLHRETTAPQKPATHTQKSGIILYFHHLVAAESKLWCLLNTTNRLTQFKCAVWTFFRLLFCTNNKLSKAMKMKCEIWHYLLNACFLKAISRCEIFNQNKMALVTSWFFVVGTWFSGIAFVLVCGWSHK